MPSPCHGPYIAAKWWTGCFFFGLLKRMLIPLASRRCRALWVHMSPAHACPDRRGGGARLIDRIFRPIENLFFFFFFLLDKVLLYLIKREKKLPCGEQFCPDLFHPVIWLCMYAIGMYIHTTHMHGSDCQTLHPRSAMETHVLSAYAPYDTQHWLLINRYAFIPTDKNDPRQR